ncbi:DUF2167 domain-containing protein [Deinococcus sp.]|uniref:DUF2167 domain-containing protein n=1 Tax=Deinococcus sp. TaxID=47478 RepID=UPI003C7C8C2F
MKKLCLLLPLLALAAPASARSGSTPPAAAPVLHYQSRPLTLLNGKVMVQASPGLRYLDPADSRRVIVDLWGNPPAAADDILGMLIPGSTAPDARDGWAIVLTENRDGHVGDSDAASTDYRQLLKDMQQGVQDNNDARTKAGYEPIRLIGWAEPPSYDASTHKMIWAKELAFGDAKPADDSLNYAVRVLGRDNVLELNAVGGVGQLAQIRQGMTAVLPAVTFTPGNRYEDYQGGSDRLAGYGVAGLIAGGVVAKKLGLLALLPLILKKGWILILAFLGLVSRVRGAIRNRGAGRTVQAIPAAIGGMPPVHPDLGGGRVSLSKTDAGALGRHGRGK